MLESKQNRVDDRQIQKIIAALNNVEDLSSLLELDDVRDELDTLEKLFSTQEKVINTLKYYYEIMDSEGEVKHTRAIGWLDNALDHVKEYKETAASLNKECCAVVKNVRESGIRAYK